MAWLEVKVAPLIDRFRAEVAAMAPPAVLAMFQEKSAFPEILRSPVSEEIAPGIIPTEMVKRACSHHRREESAPWYSDRTNQEPRKYHAAKVPRLVVVLLPLLVPNLQARQRGPNKAGPITDSCNGMCGQSGYYFFDTWLNTSQQHVMDTTSLGAGVPAGAATPNIGIF